MKRMLLSLALLMVMVSGCIGTNDVYRRWPDRNDRWPDRDQREVYSRNRMIGKTRDGRRVYEDRYGRIYTTDRRGRRVYQDARSGRVYRDDRYEDDRYDDDRHDNGRGRKLGHYKNGKR